MAIQLTQLGGGIVNIAAKDFFYALVQGSVDAANDVFTFPGGTQYRLSSFNLSGGGDIERGIFTLNAAGTVATGGVLTNPGANPTLTIPTTNKLRLAHFHTRDTGLFLISSIGKDDLLLRDCVYSLATDGSYSDIDNSIRIGFATLVSFPNGWTGRITAIGATSYAITFTKVGGGLDITGQWHGITITE